MALTSSINLTFGKIKFSCSSHSDQLEALWNLRSSSAGDDFFSSFCKALDPMFCAELRNDSTERFVLFVIKFVCFRYYTDVSQNFMERFIRFLLNLASSTNDCSRFRACQIISEIILHLPEEEELSDDLCDEVITVMKERVLLDSFTIVRDLAIRALSRFNHPDFPQLYSLALSSEQNAEVRKTLVLAFPPLGSALPTIIGCTLDASESVREAAYSVLFDKFPIQSISVKHRTVILHRGLSDVFPVVVKGCLKNLNDAWLIKYCKGDPIELLKLLDVQTYESIGSTVIKALLKAELVNVHDVLSIQEMRELLDPELALFWRVVFQYLQTEAQARDSDAASTTGALAADHVAEASKIYELLDKLLPGPASDYIVCVKAHIDEGSKYRFAARQLLLVGEMIKYDATTKSHLKMFVCELLHESFDCEFNEDEENAVIGDGISLGGDSDWANAVYTLTKRVCDAPGEFEEFMLGVIEKLAKPCIDGNADVRQWMRCLAVVGLFLKNVQCFGQLQGSSIGLVELLYSLMLPGGNHYSHHVREAAVKCMDCYELLLRVPSLPDAQTKRGMMLEEPTQDAQTKRRRMTKKPTRGIAGNKQKKRWTPLETETLVSGVEALGKGNWAAILRENAEIFQGRTAVNLKDKYRNVSTK